MVKRRRLHGVDRKELLRDIGAQRAIDLVIAGTALEHRLTVITRNVEDCRSIPGLSTQPMDGWYI